MKRIHNYILLSVFAFVLASCSEDEVIDNNGQGQVAGDIQFGLSLSEASSRTIYGPEDQDNHVFPIYWVNGDKIQVFSPQGLEGRKNAEYEVKVESDLQNYADKLIKTGAYGVQWGTGYTVNEKPGYHDFYSLYPSGNYKLSTDGTKAENITINSMQNIVVNGGVVKSDMEDCLMYAKTTGVAKGDVVNLQYNPITTVLMIKVTVAENQTGTDPDNFTIQSIKLEANTDIVGTFSLNIADGSFGGFETNKANEIIQADIVNTSTGGYHTIKNKESFEIPLFLAPVSTLNDNKVVGPNVNGWKISIVANNNIYTKTLNIDKTLTPGQIHKITLPELAPAATEWDVTKWMTYIPRNVYLSEVSIPGTWNSLNVDCQSDTSIKNQYSKGVRAFHIDTRWRADNKPWLGETFTGISKPDITELSVAVGGSDKTYKYDGGNLMRAESASTFSEYLGQITEEVKEDEYMVVFCTFSQNSYNGERCPSTWYNAISTACGDNDKVYDAKGLTSNTLVGDVLDKVIVVVNLDTPVSSSALPADSKCLFTYVPMQLPSDHYADTKSHTDELYYGSTSKSGISMFTSHAQISTTGSSAVNCDDRGYSHPLTNRDALVKSFWDWSMSNYGTTNYNHNKWIYLGLGGYIMTSLSSSGSGYDTVENRYAPMVYNRIDEMGKNNVPFYPVGIILMNNKKGSNYTDSNGTDLKYGFSDVCKQILTLNNKYRLQYDSSKPADYKPADDTDENNSNTPSQTRDSYDSSLSNGGNVISLD